VVTRRFITTILSGSPKTVVSNNLSARNVLITIERLTPGIASTDR
jgi:hypothetical protein